MQIIEDAAVHEQYSRVITPEPAMNEETEDVCALLQQCLDLRSVCNHLQQLFQIRTQDWVLEVCACQTSRGSHILQPL